ncbi:hypothetical protein MHU86_22588 [Fragilaria crotonensis]|nr:hypothetical protein MHU86_22588 [Fragilaria crotonensis]
MDRAFVFDEMTDFCKQGYWIVLPYSEVREWRMLRISPIGAVPQRDRRPWLIVDYSFSDLNAKTLQLAPAEAMQFGWALQRVFKHIVEADPRYGPVHLAKIDIADGIASLFHRPTTNGDRMQPGERTPPTTHGVRHPSSA